MNQLRWYSSDIWDQQKYDDEHNLYSNQQDWLDHLTEDKTLFNFGAYFQILKNVLKNNNSMEIEFMKIDSHTYQIKADVLLTARREYVMKTRGITVYMRICRLLRILNKNGNTLTPDIIIKKAHSIYPDLPQSTNLKSLIADIIHYQLPFNSSERIIWDHFVSEYFNFLTFLPQPSDAILARQFENVLNYIKSNCLIDNSSLLNYKKLGDSALRHKVLTDLGIKVCPYCNRNYITWYQSKDNQRLTTADLDHYYQKDYYPLFALSLFNFVPSCQVCNSRLKGINPMEDTLYPFEEGFDQDASFKFQLSNPDPTVPGYAKSLLHSWLGIPSTSKPECKISIEIKKGVSMDKCKRIDGSIRLFRLEEIYSTHIDKALDIAMISRNFDNPDYMYYCNKLLENLNKQLHINSLSIFKAYYDTEWLLFGYHWHIKKNIINYDAPLSRMTWDIFQQHRNQQFPYIGMVPQQTNNQN